MMYFVLARVQRQSAMVNILMTTIPAASAAFLLANAGVCDFLAGRAGDLYIPTALDFTSSVSGPYDLNFISYTQKV